MDEKKLYPKIIGIPITNRCNATCEFCLRKKLKNFQLLEEEDMSLDKVELLCQKIKGKTDLVNISAGYGEAFLHKDIDKIIDVFENNSIKIIAYTNGINIKRYERIVNRLYRCVISVNRTNYQEALFWDLKMFNANNIRISSIINLNENDFDFLDMICKQSEKLGIVVELNWLFNYNGLLTKSKNKTINEIILLLKLHNNIVLPKISESQTIMCQIPWQSLYFTKEGYLRNCCIFYSFTEQFNIFEQDLETIWNSDYIRKIRESFISNKPFDFCKGCPIGYGVQGGVNWEN